MQIEFNGSCCVIPHNNVMMVSQQCHDDVMFSHVWHRESDVLVRMKSPCCRVMIRLTKLMSDGMSFTMSRVLPSCFTTPSTCNIHLCLMRGFIDHSIIHVIHFHFVDTIQMCRHGHSLVGQIAHTECESHESLIDRV